LAGEVSPPLILPLTWGISPIPSPPARDLSSNSCELYIGVVLAPLHVLFFLEDIAPNTFLYSTVYTVVIAIFGITFLAANLMPRK
jgi:preprotein translocase subunit SecY